MNIKDNLLVEKRNVLNELRSNNMTLQELRFFSIYLAKINARDISSRIVRFPISDFQKIMDLGPMKISQLTATTDSLLMKIVHIPNDRGGYEAFQLFKRCKVDKNSSGEWFMEIDAHDDALPLMFDFKNRYFTYELWNALRLRSSNQVRMYEILKQYEFVGERVLSIDDLKALLGIDKKEYIRFGDFKHDVLEICKEALALRTDLCFTYEPYGKRGPGGKVLSLKFKITKNKNFVDQLTLDEFINVQDYADVILSEDEVKEISNTITPDTRYIDRINLFRETAFCNEFSFEEVVHINSLIASHFSDDISACNYLIEKFTYMNQMSAKRKIAHRFRYLTKLIELDMKD